MIQQWQRIVFFNIFVLILGESVFGDSQNCTVGDLTQGYWQQINPPSECPIPGAPAIDSDWPNPQHVPDQWFNGTWSSFAYRIEGRYKMNVKLESQWSILNILPNTNEVNPYLHSQYTQPAKPACIDGLAEAFASQTCEVWRLDLAGWDTCDITYTATSATCWYAQDCAGSMPEENYNKYTWFWEEVDSYYEWMCNPLPIIDNKKNEGPPNCD